MPLINLRKIFYILLASLAALTVLAFNSNADAANINLTTGNAVIWRGVIDEDSVTSKQLKLVELVKARGKATYPIYLVLDSPGGSIYAGEAFIAFAQTLQNVHTIAIFAASMASAIVESLPGRRYVTSNGILMFHRAKGGFEGQFEEGEVEQQLALWKSIVRGMEQRSANRVGLSLEAYKAKVKDEWWIYGFDNVTQNTADEIVSLTCSQALIDQREVIVSQFFIFSVKQVFSGCPLFRGPISQETN